MMILRGVQNVNERKNKKEIHPCDIKMTGIDVPDRTTKTEAENAETSNTNVAEGIYSSKIQKWNKK